MQDVVPTCGSASTAVGDWRADLLSEMSGPVRPPAALLSGFDPAMAAGKAWLYPEHVTSDGDYVATIGGWLLRSGGRVVVFDVGAGADKPRPSHPRYHNRPDTFLSSLAALGVAPAEVDTVVLSHLHVDHVGGATTITGSGWRPAFPAARYIVGAVELEDSRRKAAASPATGDASLIFADSVAPLIARNVLSAVDLPYTVAPGMTLEAAPGHTLGHAMLRILSGGTEALFTADLAHSVLQFVHPDLNTVFCEHPELARRTRRRVLEEAARRDLQVFPMHFGHVAPVRVRQHGSGFVVSTSAPPGPPR